MGDLASGIPSLYNSVAEDFDRNRSKALEERFYLHEVLTRLQGNRTVLDLGCGSGEPIAQYFIEAECILTGVDIAPAMLAMCRNRFPKQTWIEHDMRSVALSQQFDAIIAWDSFFHLAQNDQRRMFATFEKHIAPSGLLLFTSGPSESVVIGDLFGHPLYHASLHPEEYAMLLKQHGFEVILHRPEDPECGRHTVWLAQHHTASEFDAKLKPLT